MYFGANIVFGEGYSKVYAVSILQLLRSILNRNSTLLPAYFAHNEVCTD